MECLTNCNRAVIFDYSNLSSYERKIYEIGHNRFIFNDFEKLKINFIEYLKNKNDHFGNWGKFISEIHVSSDNLGYQRVADLIYVLFNLINKNSKLESIKKLSTYLSKKYGNDKIYYNK